ncbi:glutamic acid-rich protein-like [Eublepharis macularius]|uniref:Glutamic acid-rich protein-like n=1 Tax=Eublepharis macularius TaxID=481883 RepID=A0AA97L4J4_EUBMA|nr:glutamic acid-rich protein-like [Eublepharis macularius]
MSSLSEVNARFALDMFHLLSEEHPSDNLLFSPMNLTSGLGLLLLGSGCNTAAELEKVLHWDELKELKEYWTTNLSSSDDSAAKSQDKIPFKPHPEPQAAKPSDDKQQSEEPQPVKPWDERHQGHDSQHTKPSDDRHQAHEHQDTKPSHDRHQAQEPQHTKPSDDRHQAQEPQHTKPSDDRHQAQEPQHTKPSDTRRQAPQRQHAKPSDDRHQAQEHHDRRQAQEHQDRHQEHHDRHQAQEHHDRRQAQEHQDRHQAQEHQDRHQAQEPQLTKPTDTRRQAPQRRHAKPSDERHQAQEPQHTKPSDDRHQAQEHQDTKPSQDRHQAQEPQLTKPTDTRRQAPQRRHTKPSDERHQAEEPQHTKPSDDRHQAQEPQHAKPSDDRHPAQEPEHTKPHDTRRQAPQREHTKPSDARHQAQEHQDTKPSHDRHQAQEPQHAKPRDDRHQAQEPQHTKPSDTRRQAPERQHAKPSDERHQAQEPQHTKPSDDRHPDQEPQHTKPKDDKQQSPQHPCPCPKPLAPEKEASPEKSVSDDECENPEGVHTAFSKILKRLNRPSTNYVLSTANKLYGDYAVAFIQKFLYCALKLYLTEVEGVDFHCASEEVRRLLNLWVEIQSHGKIKDLLPKDSLDCLTELLLVNTLYFKGLWEVEFKKELTEEAPFFVDSKAFHTVQLMHTRGTFNTGTVLLNNVEVQVLEIPYKNHESSLFILLPTDESSQTLLQLEDALTHEDLLDWSNDLKLEVVEVAIPKFSMEKTIEADKYLNLSNLNDAGKADFSGATTTHGVALSQLVHDTFFEIDEEGGEEPATKDPQVSRRQRCGPVPFIADHPFLYYVRHNCTKSILVFGRFSKPE